MLHSSVFKPQTQERMVRRGAQALGILSLAAGAAGWWVKRYEGASCVFGVVVICVGVTPAVEGALHAARCYSHMD